MCSRRCWIPPPRLLELSVVHLRPGCWPATLRLVLGAATQHCLTTLRCNGFSMLSSKALSRRTLRLLWPSAEPEFEPLTILTKQDGANAQLNAIWMPKMLATHFQ